MIFKSPFSKMSRFIRVFLMAMSFAPLTGLAQKSAFRVGFVDMQAAILKTDEGAAAKSTIELAAESKNKELKDSQDELKKLDEEFQKQMSILSEETKLQKQKEFQVKLQNFNAARAAFENDMRKKELDATQKIISNLSQILEGIAKKKGYDIVFEKGAGAVLYSSKGDDLTEDLVKEYNGRHRTKK